MSPRHHSLDAVFAPQSIAVIGASPTSGSVGSILMSNLLATPFGGVVYPVNPRRRAVHGVRCYPGVRDLPEVVDLAVIATPAATVPQVIDDCLAQGVRAAIVVSAGFSEIGEAGAALEQTVREKVRGRMRLIGPNCLGILRPPAGLNASFAASMARSGSIALLSQSGAICASILDWARQTHVGFSAFVSVGSMIDTDFADLIDYFGDDPHTRSILLYMEAMGNPRKFLSAARAVARTKPIIVVKAGRHEAGARAARSHTGTMVGADAVFDAAFRRAGVLRVTHVRDLFNMSELLAMQPHPVGPNLAILTNAGGPGVLAADAVMLGGGQLATLSPATIEALDRVLPAYWSHGNPIDLLGDATPERYRECLEIVVRDPDVQGLLVLLSPQAMTDATRTAQQLVPFAHLPDKPILAAWLGGPAVQPGRDLLHQAGIPTFDTPESAVTAFLNLVRFRQTQNLLYETPPALPEIAYPADQVRAIFDAVRAQDRCLLTEVEARRALAAYHLPTPPIHEATTAEAAVAHAQAIGFPVVLKLLSHRITHKSAADGVLLNLADESAVRAGFAQIEQASRAYAERHHLGERVFEGVSVQPMIRERGYELILGSHADPLFGPVILFGTGGVLVEVFQDHALALPPLNRALAQHLMAQTRIHAALRGTLGQRPVALEAVEMALVHLSQLLVDFPEIEEIDINPLLATPNGVMVLDARIVLADRASTPTRRRLAIQPYPNQWTHRWQLRDGTPLLIRAIRPEDEPLIVDLFHQFSPTTIRLRYFSLIRQLSRDRLIRFCHLDYDRELALAAVRHDEQQRPHFVGVARYYLDQEPGEAEFSVVVPDAWQGKGIGYYLMQRLIEVARQNGVRRLYGLVLRENGNMLQLGRELGFLTENTDDPAVIRLQREL